MRILSFTNQYHRVIYGYELYTYDGWSAIIQQATANDDLAKSSKRFITFKVVIEQTLGIDQYATLHRLFPKCQFSVSDTELTIIRDVTKEKYFIREVNKIKKCMSIIK